MKKTNKIREFAYSIFLLIISLMFILIGYLKVALFLMTLGLFGILFRIYISKKIVCFSKEWADAWIFIMILGIIISSLIFGYKWRFVDVILCVIILGGFYLYYRFIVSKHLANKSLKKFSSQKILYFILLFIIMLPMIPLSVIIIIEIIFSHSISLNLLWIDLTLLIIVILIHYIKKNLEQKLLMKKRK